MLKLSSYSSLQYEFDISSPFQILGIKSVVHRDIVVSAQYDFYLSVIFSLLPYQVTVAVRAA